MPNSREGSLVCVLGPMGTGKSTFVLGAEKSGAVIFRELPPDENPHFESFYEALKSGEFPNPHVLQSQLAFLAASLAQAEEISQLMIKKPEQVIVWEMPIWGHFMYAWMQHLGEQPIMSERDWQVYCQAFNEAYQRVIELGIMPDVIAVTLIHDIELLLERIKKRDRKEEAGIPPAYVEAQLNYWRTLIEGGLLLPRQALDMLQVNESAFQADLVTLDAAKLNWTDVNGFNNSWRQMMKQANQHTWYRKVSQALQTVVAV